MHVKVDVAVFVDVDINTYIYFEVDIDFEAAPIVSTSYCWEGVDLPDVDARTLRKLAAALQGTWDGAEPKSGLPLFAAWGFEDVGVFFDFSSLYQNKPTPRTPAQQQSFKRALCAPRRRRPTPAPLSRCCRAADSLPLAHSLAFRCVCVCADAVCAAPTCRSGT